ncbi:hypothetical protein [Polaromonas sp. CG_9.11]|uniref:hypothetical protein n=1 Tax=Polaromonas sp. CG_9.11 TaxID=2787730 RepID=UPI0018CB13AA|nr:hypothetical protein [Polaromonas sp. CG_9.11]
MPEQLTRHGLLEAIENIAIKSTPSSAKAVFDAQIQLQNAPKANVRGFISMA